MKTKKEIKLWDIVVGIHNNRATIGRVVDVDFTAKLSSHGLKEKKFKYLVRYGGASEGYYFNNKKLFLLNTWQADRIKKVLTF